MMARYTEERRQAVVAKLLPPQSLSPQAVAEQEGISLPTIYKWRSEVRAKGRCPPVRARVLALGIGEPVVRALRPGVGST